MPSHETENILRAEIQARVDTTYERVTTLLTELQQEQTQYYESFDRLVVGKLLERHRERIDEMMAIRNAAFIRRIDYRDLREDQAVSIYVGAIALESEGCSIISWAAPLVGQLLYPPHTSRTYQAQAEKIIELDISHRIIKKIAMTMDGLKSPAQQEPQPQQNGSPAESIHDVPLTGSGADEYLQYILKQKKHEALGVIIQSIQQEQYQIITSPVTKLKIIQGVPGSGKTVIALHRIAYLLFNKYSTTGGERIKPENVLFIGPNQRFFEHIKHVLPMLGEHDTRSRTPFELLESFHLTGGHRVRQPQENLDVLLTEKQANPRSLAFEREAMLGKLAMVEYIKYCVNQIIKMEIRAFVSTPFALDIEAFATKCFQSGYFVESAERKARSEWEYLIDSVSECFHSTEEFLFDLVRQALASVQGRYLLLAHAFQDVLFRWIWEKIQSDINYRQVLKYVVYTKREAMTSEFADYIKKAVQRYTSVQRNAASVQGILLSKKKLTAEDIRRTKVRLERGQPDEYDVLKTSVAIANRVFVSMFRNENLSSYFGKEHATIMATHNGKVASPADVVLLSWILCYLQKQIFASGYTTYTHVVCDEAQDMSPLFFDLLTRIFGRADFTLYGDMNQNILNYGEQTNWDEYFPTIENQQREMFQLRHTYRSTAEIIDYSTTILQKGRFLEGSRAIPIVKSGNEPREFRYTGMNELASLLVRLSDEHEGQSIAVITKKKTTAEGLRTLIASEIGRGMRNFQQKCTFISVGEAKGLEYDVVFLVNADSNSYPNDMLHARLLYVATTRAAKQLYVLYDGVRSQLLS
jgi:DNA helicase-2/ATP-dependent DNA helicase PcrA